MVFSHPETPTFQFSIHVKIFDAIIIIGIVIVIIVIVIIVIIVIIIIVIVIIVSRCTNLCQ